MPLSHEHIESKTPEKIQIYILTRAELLITLCNEIPCTNILRLTNSISTVQQTHITNLHNWKLSCLLQYIFIHMLLHCFHYIQQLSYCFNLNLVRYLRFQGNDWLQVAFFSFKVLLGLFQTLRKESIKYIWSYCFLLLQRL